MSHTPPGTPEFNPDRVSPLLSLLPVVIVFFFPASADALFLDVPLA